MPSSATAWTCQVYEWLTSETLGTQLLALKEEILVGDKLETIKLGSLQKQEKMRSPGEGAYLYFQWINC